MRTLRITIVLALALACVVPAAAQAARYHGRAAGNDPDGSGLIPKHTFVGGDDFPVQFRDSRAAGTRYRVCAWVHGKRQGCRGGRTGRRNHWDTIVASSIAYPGAGGKTIYRWYVNGERVASWSVRFNVEPE
jgi:hypothetical protein